MTKNKEQKQIELKKLLEKIDFRAKKTLGQNFIFDSNITDKIVSYILNMNEKIVLEVGPGPGTLSCSIFKKEPKKYYLIEKDDRFSSLLSELFQNDEHVKVTNGDALEIQEEELIEEIKLNGDKIVIIANLPYNISTQLLFKWLEKHERVDSMYLMFQKEVADRITAVPRTKAYGKMSIMVQWLFNVESIITLHPSCFTPAPKIFSSVVSFLPRAKKFDADYKKLSKICDIIFHNRRKTISNNLKPVMQNYLEILEKLQISPTARAEELNIETICKLSHYI